MRAKEQSSVSAGDLALQTIALPRDTNGSGDIYAGWLIGQMDLAASTAAMRVSRGRATTVAMERVEFLSPVKVGEQVSCYTQLLDTGSSSMKIRVEAFVTPCDTNAARKVTETTFIYVAIDERGGIRNLPGSS
ncbi:MAG: acyl-CoA thioesterase [Oleiphilus sp.]|nr:MAG: acyl-CoA thioesterase [Oleiphilus sp.]